MFRTTLFIRFLYLSTGLLGLVVLSGGAAVATGSLPPAEVGQIVFQIFFMISLMVISLVAPAYAATALTGEKERATYESLVLTGMDPVRIVWGKFLASYCVFTLVIVAYSPIVGIAFLFGGISPLHVLFGFYGLLVVLAPAVALGVALSARLSSSRISILLALLLFVPTASFGTATLAALGHAAKRDWNLSMEGPFWFAEALSARFFEPDTVGLLGLLPLFIFGMSVWYLIAAAVAGVRPAAEDRSTSFKRWTWVATAGGTIALFGIGRLFDANDAGEAGVAILVASGPFLQLVALTFMNEPPLPPRRSRPGRLSAAFGPGAAPTLRFGALAIVGASLLFGLALCVTRHLEHPGLAGHLRYDAALLVVAVGNAAVLAFLLALGAWLRLALGNGVAARVLALAIVFALVVLPLLLSVAVDPDSLNRLDRRVPLAVLLSPLCPNIVGLGIADHGSPERALELVLPAVLYGLGALFFWVLVETRVRRLRRVRVALPGDASGDARRQRGGRDGASDHTTGGAPRETAIGEPSATDEAVSRPEPHLGGDEGTHRGFEK